MKTKEKKKMTDTKYKLSEIFADEAESVELESYQAIPVKVLSDLAHSLVDGCVRTNETGRKVLDTHALQIAAPVVYIYTAVKNLEIDMSYAQAYDLIMNTQLKSQLLETETYESFIDFVDLAVSEFHTDNAPEILLLDSLRLLADSFSDFLGSAAQSMDGMDMQSAFMSVLEHTVKQNSLKQNEG